MTPGIPNPKATALLLLCATHLPAQTPHKTLQQTVTVVVVNAHTQPAQRISGALVTLRYVNGNLSAASEDSKPTGPNGEAYLLVSSDAPQRGDLRIEISGVTDLVIYEPADGQLSSPDHQITALPTRITVRLEPKGSPKLEEDAQLEAVMNRVSQMNRLSHTVNILRRQNERQQGQIAGLQSQLDAAKLQADSQNQAAKEGLVEWVTANGLDVQDAEKQIERWAHSIQSKPESTAEQKALAAFALKDYDLAAKGFGEAKDDGITAYIEKKRQEREKAKREEAQDNADLRKLLDDTTKQSNSLQLKARYHEASVTLAQTCDFFAAQAAAAPSNDGLHGLILEAGLDLASARRQEGDVTTADKSLPLLAQAAGDYENLAREYLSAGDKANWAFTQNGLGLVLASEGERETGAKAAALLDQAVQAYQNALGVRTRADFPKAWAHTQSNLANALTEEAERASGDKAAALFGQAAQAYRSVLEVFTKADSPQQWAGTQHNLGVMLYEEGEHASGSKAAALFGEAVEAYRRALEVYSKADLPQDWAMTQGNLANVFWEQGKRATGDEASTLLDAAVQAYRSALEVYTQTELPQNWATTQNNLGNVLADEGERAGGDKAQALFDEAVRAYRRSLEVRTRSGLPRSWAQTQYNLGIAQEDEGDFDAAEQDFKLALEVEPDTVDYLSGLSHLDHEFLFRFDRALEVDERLLQLSPTMERYLDLVEATLTAARFDICVTLAAKSSDIEMSSRSTPVRDVIQLACEFAAAQKERAFKTAQKLNDESSGLQPGSWMFTGTIHFLKDSPAFSTGRAAWIALFTAVQNGNAPAMTAALQQLEQLLQP